MSAIYIVGFRTTMLVVGAGSFYLVTLSGFDNDQYLYHAWHMIYVIMGLTMLVGVLTTRVIREQVFESVQRHEYISQEYLRFVILFMLAVMGFVVCFNFFKTIALSSIQHFLCLVSRSKIYYMAPGI